MALFDYIQEAHGFGSPNFTATFAGSVVAGNSILVIATNYAGQAVIASDNKGNTYTPIGSTFPRLLLASNVTGGASFQVTGGGTSNNTFGLCIELEGNLVHDVSVSASLSGVTAFDSTSITSTTANTAWLGFVTQLGGTITALTGEFLTSPTTIIQNYNDGIGIDSCYHKKKTSITTGAFSGTLSASSDAHAGVVALKEVTGGGGKTVTVKKGIITAVT